MQVSTDTQPTAPTWRENWFIKNCLVPIPIIGPFFKATDVKCALHQSGKSAGMLLGGTTYMMFNTLGMNMHDSPSEKFGKMAADMAIGMTLGVVAYNGLFSAGKALHQKCCPTPDLAEIQRRLVK